MASETNSLLRKQKIYTTSKDQALNLIFEWVKTSIINKKQFKELLEIIEREKV